MSGRSRHGAPRSQDPEDAIEDTTVIHSWHAARLIRQHRLHGRPLVVREFVAHDSAPSVGGLNHGSAVMLNCLAKGPFGRYAPKAHSLCSMTQTGHFHRQAVSAGGSWNATRTGAPPMDVGGWLRKLGLEQYEATFRENNVDETVLPSLMAEDLKDLGVGSVGHRRKLLDTIAAL